MSAWRCSCGSVEVSEYPMYCGCRVVLCRACLDEWFATCEGPSSPEPDVRAAPAFVSGWLDSLRPGNDKAPQRGAGGPSQWL